MIFQKIVKIWKIYKKKKNGFSDFGKHSKLISKLQIGNNFSKISKLQIGNIFDCEKKDNHIFEKSHNFDKINNNNFKKKDNHIFEKSHNFDKNYNNIFEKKKIDNNIFQKININFEKKDNNIFEKKDINIFEKLNNCQKKIQKINNFQKKNNFDKKIIIDISILNPTNEEEFELYKKKKKEFFAQFKNIQTITVKKNFDKKNFCEQKFFKKKEEEEKIPEKISILNISPELIKCFNGELDDNKIIKKNKKIKKFTKYDIYKNISLFDVKSHNNPNKTYNELNRAKADLEKPKHNYQNYYYNKLLNTVPPVNKSKSYNNLNKTLYTEYSERDESKYLTVSNQEISWYKNHIKRKMLRNKAKKISYFWRGKTFNYPFIFKKLFKEHYRGTGEENMSIVFDISNKVTSLKDKSLF